MTSGGLHKSRRKAGILAAAVLGLGLVTPSVAQRRPHPSANNPPVTLDGNPVQALFVQGSTTTKIYMLAGAGANITLQVGDEGVLLVDTGSEALAEQTLAAIRHLTKDLTDQPIRWIVNTHAHPDATGGNVVLSKAGEWVAQNISGGGQPIFDPRNSARPATIIAQENVVKRMASRSGQEAPRPVDAWPLLTYISAKQAVSFNGEPIEIISVPAAHTDGDSLVFFRHSDVLSTGGLFVTTSFPVIDLRAGGTINGIIDGLNRIIDITIPEDHQEAGTFVISGEGRLCDEADVVFYRDMVTIIRDRVADLRAKGMTIEQVKAAKPAVDYERRYATSSWTADMFVEAVYRTLPPLPAPATSQRTGTAGAGRRP